MSGPKNGILSAWGSTALRPVELPSGLKVLLKLPDVNDLVLRDALPADLRDLAMRYAQGGIEITKLDSNDLKRFIQFTYELISRSIRYMAAPDSPAWDDFRRTGSDPSVEGWQPVTLTAGELSEMDVDPDDVAALGQIAGRQKTPNEITAMSRFDRGLLSADQVAAAAGSEAPGQKVGDYATFRDEPGSADSGPDGEDVRDAPVGPTRGRGSSRRVRRR